MDEKPKENEPELETPSETPSETPVEKASESPETPTPIEPSASEPDTPVEEPAASAAETPSETPVATPVEEPTPVIEPPVVAAAVATPQPTHNSAGVVVLQWLTYAFWGWLILGMIWLITVILVNALLNESVSTTVPYAIAASVVMLPIAFVTDFFYRKHEPPKKSGAAMVIMVIHAVLFALLGIGALIIAVFTGLNAAINTSSDITAQLVILLTAGFAALVYATTFLRTLNPFKSKKFASLYGIGMLALTVLLLVFAIVGPVVQSVATRDDRLIEDSLPDVQRDVSDYIEENKDLPNTLDDVTFNTEGARQLVEGDKVTYKQVTTTQNITSSGLSTTFKYELCVTYVAPSAQDRYDYGSSKSEYSTYISTYSHGEGETCYKLQQTEYADSLLDL